MGEVTPAKASSKATVVVGCRYPHGLLLRLFKMVKQQEVLPGGRTQQVAVAQPLPQQVKLSGYANPAIPVAMDSRGQYGVTRDVPAAFFEEWLKQNADSDIVKNRIVFAADTDADLQDMGKDFRRERNGLEPVDPNKPGERMGGKGKMKIEPAKSEDAAA